MALLTEQSKYEFSKNLYIITCVSFMLISVANSFGKNVFVYQSAMSFCISFAILLFLIKSKNYKIAATITIALSSIDLIGGFFMDSKHGGTTDLFWIINLTIFIYYTLGRKHAIYYLIGMLSISLSISQLADFKVITLIPKIGDLIFVEITYSINVITNLVIFLYLINVIVHDAKKSENILIENNRILELKEKEKTTMLREIHHRVKNNLQVITSLLRLQIHQIDDDKIKQPFQEAINRVQAMALIHSKMYQGDTVKQVNLKLYLEDLVSDLVITYPTHNTINTIIEADKCELELNDLVPFSLIINELITNSIKHGFKTISTGEIKININRNDNHLNLTYTDNGIWQTPKKEKSFGLELIETLVTHFDGEFNLDNKNKTVFTFLLNLNN